MPNAMTMKPQKMKKWMTPTLSLKSFRCPNTSTKKPAVRVMGRSNRHSGRPVMTSRTRRTTAYVNIARAIRRTTMKMAPSTVISDPSQLP